MIDFQRREAGLTLRVSEFGDQAGRRLLRQALRALGRRGHCVDGIDSAETPMSRALDAYLHRGKRRVGLDRESEPGRKLLDRLAEKADVSSVRVRLPSSTR